MPRNGSGTYSLPQSPFTAGTVISSAAVNSDLGDIATALTGSLPRNGEAGMTGQFKTTDGSAGAPAISFNTEPTTGFYRVGNGQVGLSIAGVLAALFTSAGLTGVTPIGTIADYGGATAPATWLLCYGQAVSRTTYAALFNIIGTTFGSGDGSTTFNVPDLRGTVSVGKDNMGGSASGRITTTYYGTDPTVLANRGGSQNRALSTTHLPPYTPTGNVNLSDPSHTHTFQYGGGSHVGGGGSFGFDTALFSTTNTGAAVTGIAASFAGNAQGGSSTAFAIIAPSLIVNKIIYAGV